jgi:DNA-binding GntR family transcriptional regulator
MDAITVEDELPLAELAYRHLRRAIVRCEYDPGERLRVDELGKRFEISNTPIREALSRLVEQGLVRSIDNRGFRVAPLTVEGIADLTRVRLLIESEALREALEHGDDVWEANMVASAHALSLIEQRLGDKHVALDNDWTERHRNFHLSLYSGCKSQLLKLMVEQLFDNAERYRRYSASNRKTERIKHDEHTKILNCILTRDVTKSLELVRHHIVSTMNTVTIALNALSENKSRTQGSNRLATGV